MDIHKKVLDKFSKDIEKSFEGKFRRDGVTKYFNHLEDTRKNIIMLYGDNLIYEMIALSHDILEDTNTTEEELNNMVVKAFDGSEDYFNKDSVELFALWVVTATKDLTKRDSEDYFDYLRRVKNNNHAFKVKIADILSNLSDNPTKKQVEKYQKALKIFRE